MHLNVHQLGAEMFVDCVSDVVPEFDRQCLQRVAKVVVGAGWPDVVDEKIDAVVEGLGQLLPVVLLMMQLDLFVDRLGDVREIRVGAR